MNSRRILTILLGCGLALAQQAPPPPAQGAPGRGGRFGGFSEPEPIDNADHTGWKQIFDGETLNGWDGNKEIWHVEDGDRKSVV